jgi:hypothetical protein
VVDFRLFWGLIRFSGGFFWSECKETWLFGPQKHGQNVVDCMVFVVILLVVDA